MDTENNDRLDGPPMLLWHPAVHRHFDEELYYFLIGLTGFKSGDFDELKDQLSNTCSLAGYCIYPALGPYDIVLRAWLNRIDLENVLKFLESFRDRREFSDYLAFKAGQMEHWPFEKQPDIDLNFYTSDDYAAAQEGDAALREEMGLHALLRFGPISDSTRVKFYVAVGAIPPQYNSVQAMIRGKVKAATLAQADLANVSFYEGTGFCSILVKGLAPDINSVFDVATGIRQEISEFQMLSSTFVASTRFAREDDSLNPSSIAGLPRFDKSCMDWVPEMYDLEKLRKTGKEKTRQVEDFLLSHRLFFHLGDDREWLQRLISPLVHRDISSEDGSFAAARFIGSRLAMAEHWLRTHLTALLRGLTFGDDSMVGEMARSVGIPKDRRGSLGQWLKWYAELISKDGELAQELAYTSQKEALFDNITEVRNDCDHTDGSKTTHSWQETLTMLNDFLPVFRHLQVISEKAFARAPSQVRQ